eukprot:6260343-Amphidinium_carterae.1
MIYGMPRGQALCAPLLHLMLPCVTIHCKSPAASSLCILVEGSHPRPRQDLVSRHITQTLQVCLRQSARDCKTRPSVH